MPWVSMSKRMDQQIAGQLYNEVYKGDPGLHVSIWINRKKMKNNYTHSTILSSYSTAKYKIMVHIVYGYTHNMKALNTGQ